MLIDLAFVLLIMLGCIKGYRKGLIIALFSFFAFIAGLAAALKLSSVVAERLSTNMDIPARWLPVLSFLAVFVIVVILVNLAGKILQETVESLLLGWVNRIGGVLLFTLLYCIIFSVFLFYAKQMHLLSEENARSSLTYGYIQPFGPAAINIIGDIIPFFKDMFISLEVFFNKVSNNLKH